jgi:hypothetical protein
MCSVPAALKLIKLGTAEFTPSNGHSSEDFRSDLKFAFPYPCLVSDFNRGQIEDKLLTLYDCRIKSLIEKYLSRCKITRFSDCCFLLTFTRLRTENMN